MLHLHFQSGDGNEKCHPKKLHMPLSFWLVSNFNLQFFVVVTLYFARIILQYTDLNSEFLPGPLLKYRIHNFINA